MTKPNPDGAHQTPNVYNLPEGWVDVYGYENLYIAHPDGAVAYHPNSARVTSNSSLVLLPTRLSDSGYHKIRLTDSAGLRTAWLLHHIIYRTFNGDLPPRSSGSRKKDKEIPEIINHPLYGQVVMHLDDMRDHNEASNLQLGTNKENRKMIGRARKFRDMSDSELRENGQACSMLSDIERRVLRLYKHFTVTDIVSDLGLSTGEVKSIVNRTCTWKHDWLALHV